MGVNLFQAKTDIVKMSKQIDIILQNTERTFVALKGADPLCSRTSNHLTGRSS